ncbi:YdbL family protein [Sphingomonas bacterium]|uniref:YdbL family protein n=1 Tax=Sphingomonas bacterium TaxID=1895847 RepID=UPI001576F17E|nr:YdbL family protein [Sphingomonas bacterium]
MIISRTAAVAWLILVAASALAQAADPVVEEARASGFAGEQADGYLGVIKPGGPAGLKARVDAINIQRRAIFTDTASAKPGVTVADVGAAAACQQFRTRVAVGHFYRDQAGAWRQHTSASPVALPSFCG